MMNDQTRLCIDMLTLFTSCLFTEQLSSLAPAECPHLILQALAGPMAAATASTITNPMDVVRARVQVNTGSLPQAAR